MRVTANTFPNSLVDQLNRLANRQYQLQNMAATDASGRITGVTYQGNTDLVESEIGSGVTIAAQVIGENRTGSGSRGLLADSRVGADFFGHLISLRDNLLAWDVAAVDNDRAGLMNDEENFIYHLGTNGAVQGRLETTMTVIRNRQQSLEKLVSREADADLSQTIVRLTEVQTAYQAAMQSGGTILNRSLLDFIR